MFALSDVRDRTAEFRSIESKFSSSTKPQSAGLIHQPLHTSLSQPSLSHSLLHSSSASASSFTQLSSSISLSLVSVSEKLERLTRLARGNSLFNDASDEVQQLTTVIKEDLQEIDRQLNELQTRSAAASHGHEAVVLTQLKHSLASSTLNFQSALQKRTESLKEQNNRRRQFDSSAGSGPRRRAANPLADLIHSQPNGDLDSDPAAPVQASVQRLVEPLERAGAMEDYLSSRAAAVEQIEKTIVELGEMYQRLVTLVGMQEEVTLRIDANLESTLEHVSAGHEQLLTYFDSLTGNRALIIKLFAILIVFIFFFMMFIA